MSRYRYRTSVLTGQWRASVQEAVRDAIAARQAAEDPETVSGFRWLVPGEIEEKEGVETP